MKTLCLILMTGCVTIAKPTVSAPPTLEESACIGVTHSISRAMYYSHAFCLNENKEKLSSNEYSLCAYLCDVYLQENYKTLIIEAAKRGCPSDWVQILYKSQKTVQNLINTETLILFNSPGDVKRLNCPGDRFVKAMEIQ